MKPPPLSEDAIIIRERCSGATLECVAEDEIRFRFLSHGAVLLRGFDADPWGMKHFAERFAVRFNRDQSRPAVAGTDGAVQHVTEGMAAVEPHSEQANSPFRPDAILFCCVKPSTTGGETLVWDGARAWRRLRPATREFLANSRLRFFQRYPAVRWRAFLGDDATLQTLESCLSATAGVSYFVDPDEALYLEYLCSPVVRTRYTDEPALANSLLLEHRTLQDRHGNDVVDAALTFEDGKPVDAALLAELRHALAPLTQAIAWEPGDLVMIDNIRCMHGRTAFSDRHRQLFSSMIFLNF